MNIKPPPFGIYVHWPFCKAKCPYCDFNSHIRHQPIDQASFVDALIRELDWYHEQTPDRTVSSIFFGGGTPSLMQPKTVAAIIDAITKRWSLSPEIEITLEANPTSIEAENFTGYRGAGVNRVSVGVQALNDKDLRALGRQHSVQEAMAAYHLAVRIFPRTSFDLIYARPGQSLADWRDELGRALKEQNGHMSLYQLTIEPDTTYAELARRGQLHVPSEDTASDLYELTQDLTSAAGLIAYEISNHARPGDESQHNMLYWNYGEYAGIGPGAHARLAGADKSRMALATEKHPESWRDLVMENGHAFTVRESLSATTQGEEALLMGLRLRDGIKLANVSHVVNHTKLDQLQQAGFLELTPETHLRATAQGRHVLNSVIGELIG